MFALTVGVTAALASPAAAPLTVKTESISKLGPVLVNGSGLTLYRFKADKKGTSSCSGGCAAIWPPVLAVGKAKPVAGTGVAAAKLGLFKRSTGQLQVTYGGYALYRFAADTKPGEAKGEGVEGAWFAVAPSGALVKSTPTSEGLASPTATTPSTSTPSAGTTSTPAAGYGSGY